MSNQEKLVKIIQKSSQPIIIISADVKNWQEIYSGLIKELKITPTDTIYFETSEGIGELRKKINLLNLKPHSSIYRLFIFLSIDGMNREQTNSLLKTLEEPPNYGRILLFAQSASRIIPTIKSRCQKVYFNSKSTPNELSLLSFFEKWKFNEFVQKLNETDNAEIPEMVKETIEELKNKMLNKDEMGLYKKLSNNLIRFACTNVNKKLSLEEVFIWWKSKKEE